MANSVQALITNRGREVLAQSFGGPSGNFTWSFGKFFKIGIDGNQSGQPITPDPTLVDLLSTSGSYYYQKTYQSSDILFITPTTIQFRCFLDLPEGNGNPLNEPDTPPQTDGPKNSNSLNGQAPEFFEIGIFDSGSNMVGYGTFPGETKTSSKSLNHLVSIQF